MAPLTLCPTDEKEKFEPTVFRDTIVAGLNEAGGDLEAVAKFLDTTGSRLDYRRYADTLFDILIAGSMLGESGVRLAEVPHLLSPLRPQLLVYAGL